MKKILVVLSALLLTGCASSKSKGFEPCNAKIELTGNPTTGYEWTCKLEDEELISIEEKVIYQGEGGIVGAPSLYVYELVSKKPGTTKITFCYERSWESNPVKEVVYNVKISRDGKIKVWKK